MREGTRWVHLRACATCGAVRCCDSSPRRHASAHARLGTHVIAYSIEQNEAWAWCYADEMLVNDPSPNVERPTAHSGRVLVVVDDAFDISGDEFPAWATAAVIDATEVHVLAPALGSRVSYATDDDEPVRNAARRLRRVVRSMERAGARPSAEVSRDGPLQAIETYLLEHVVDRIIIAETLEGAWREQGLVAGIEARTNSLVQCLRVGSR